MKEIMCTHLAKRGSTYYFRRKTPVDLVDLFGKEVMKSLGTKNRKEAEVLVRKLGSYYDELFAKARAAASGDDKASASTPTTHPQQIKPPAFDAGLGVDDAHVYAARYLKKLRVSRENEHAANNLPAFNSALNNLVGDAEEYLQTGVHPFEDEPGPLWKHEAKLKAVKALRKNEDLLYIEPSHPGLLSASPKHTQPLLLEQLVVKWAGERNPRLQSVDKMKLVVRRFAEIVGSNVVTSITPSSPLNHMLMCAIEADFAQRVIVFRLNQ